MNNTFLKWGAIGGLTCIILSFAINMTVHLESQTGQYLSMTTLLVYILVMIKAQLETREAQNDSLTYGQAFKSGFLTGLVGTIVYSIFWIAFIYVINPNYVDAMKALQETKMDEKLRENPGMDAIQRKQIIEMSTKTFTKPFMAIMGVVGGIVNAALLSLIISIFTKKKGSGTDASTFDPYK